jgi:hypothetical protein
MTFADELRHAARTAPAGINGHRTAHPREPVADVLAPAEGFDRLLALCQAKGVFARPFWTEMGLPGPDDAAQLQQFVARKCPVPAEAACWLTPTSAFLFTRLRPRAVYWAFTVATATPIPEAVRQDARRALWDVGIREVRADYHPENPHTQSAARLGMTLGPRGRYVWAVKNLVERP